MRFVNDFLLPFLLFSLKSNISARRFIYYKVYGSIRMEKAINVCNDLAWGYTIHHIVLFE